VETLVLGVGARDTSLAQGMLFGIPGRIKNGFSLFFEHGHQLFPRLRVVKVLHLELLAVVFLLKVFIYST